MSDVGLVLDSRFEQHDTGPGHPERPARVARVGNELTRRGLADRCSSIAARSATDAELTLVHDADHVLRVERACADGDLIIDAMDTAIGPASAEVARLAAGSLIELCSAVAAGSLARGFAAVRPPGHHAERDLALGFCLFNNVAVAAQSLRTAQRVPRVLICDWDVHHGNGTQHIFEQDRSVFYFSLHQWPLYPGTGAREETGRGAGRGFTLNCPLPPAAGDEAFLAALRDELVPAAERFRPDFVLVSAGFDAHRADPLGGLEVSTAAYGEATHILRAIADRWAGGRLASVLEGGYDLDALGDSAAEHVLALLD